jgi:hypothetical protein
VGNSVAYNKRRKEKQQQKEEVPTLTLNSYFVRKNALTNKKSPASFSLFLPLFLFLYQKG